MRGASFAPKIALSELIESLERRVVAIRRGFLIRCGAVNNYCTIT